MNFLNACFYDYPKTHVFPNIPLKVENMRLKNPFTQRAALDVADCELG